MATTTKPSSKTTPVKRQAAKSERPNEVSKRPVHLAEAPDRGQGDREAPETRGRRHPEAPDSGEGRDESLTWDFTEGRSQS